MEGSMQKIVRSARGFGYTFLAIPLLTVPAGAQQLPDIGPPEPGEARASIRFLESLPTTAEESAGASQTAPPRGSVTETGSPYRTSWRTDAILLGVAGAGTAMASAASGARTELTEHHASELSRDSVNWFDRSATSRWQLNLVDRSENLSTVITLAPFALLADRSVRQDWQVFTLMYAQTTLIQSAVPTIVKERYDRLRPFAYNPDLTYEQKTERNPGGSFPSTQATANFANAVFLSTVFSAYHPDSRWKPYVWAGSLGAASGIGYLRYASGIHYPSDIVAGALIGAAIGYAIPRLHRVTSNSLTVAPTRSAEGTGLAVSVRF